MTRENAVDSIRGRAATRTLASTDILIKNSDRSKVSGATERKTFTRDRGRSFVWKIEISFKRRSGWISKKRRR